MHRLFLLEVNPAGTIFSKICREEKDWSEFRGQSAFYLTHPGLVRFLDYPDIAGIAAPKPMLFFNGGADQLFPPSSVQEAYAKMRLIWQSQKAEEKLETKIWPGGGHEFTKEQQDEAFQWLDYGLKPK